MLVVPLSRLLLLLLIPLTRLLLLFATGSCSIAPVILMAWASNARGPGDDDNDSDDGDDDDDNDDMVHNIVHIRWGNASANSLRVIKEDEDVDHDGLWGIMLEIRKALRKPSFWFWYVEASVSDGEGNGDLLVTMPLLSASLDRTPQCWSGRNK